jgi:hypothetical protein
MCKPPSHVYRRLWMMWERKAEAEELGYTFNHLKPRHSPEASAPKVFVATEESNSCKSRSGSVPFTSGIQFKFRSVALVGLLLSMKSSFSSRAWLKSILHPSNTATSSQDRHGTQDWQLKLIECTLESSTVPLTTDAYGCAYRNVTKLSVILNL